MNRESRSGEASWDGYVHERLDLYRLARRFVSEVYLETGAFPETERFGLVAQIRRAAVSIPVNVAEGAGRASKREFIRFLNIARGSITELRVLMGIAQDCGFLAKARLSELEASIDRLFAMTSGLIRHSRLPKK